LGRRLNPESKHWKQLRAKVVKRDGKCFVCESTDNLTVHHIKPRRLGGKTVERNLMTLCTPCHDLVELHDLEWPAIINMQRERRLRFQGAEYDSKAKKYVGKDRLGVFVIYDTESTKTVIYDSIWPSVVEERLVKYGGKDKLRVA